MTGEQPDIRALRVAVLEARIAHGEAVRSEHLLRAIAENEAIEAVGGDPKALGSNEKDRDRALLLAWDNHENSAPARKKRTDAERALALAEAELMAYFISRETSGLLLHMHIGERWWL